MRVGIIEPDGILNASITKERMTKATNRAVRRASPYSRKAPFFRLRISTFSSIPLFSLVNLQDCEERFLGDLDIPDPLHPFFTLFLFLKQLPFTGDVPPVALGGHVFPQRLDRLAGDDPSPDRRLDRHLVLLAGDDSPQLGGDLASPLIGLFPVDDDR